MNALSREIAEGNMTLDEAESRLVLARRIPFPQGLGAAGLRHVRRVLLCADLRRHAAQRIGGGTGRLSCQRVSAAVRSHDLPGGFCKISCAALITLACILGCNLLGTSASHAIIGSLMILTPGIAFTMGIRDFVHGDYLSGTIRMIDALLIAASIAIGTGLVLSLYTFFTGVVVA